MWKFVYIGFGIKVYYLGNTVVMRGGDGLGGVY